MKSGELLHPNVGKNEAGVIRKTLLEVGGEGGQDDSAGPEYPVTTEHGEVKKLLGLILEMTNNMKC